MCSIVKYTIYEICTKIIHIPHTYAENVKDCNKIQNVSIALRDAIENVTGYTRMCINNIEIHSNWLTNSISQKSFFFKGKTKLYSWYFNCFSPIVNLIWEKYNKFKYDNYITENCYKDFKFCKPAHAQQNPPILFDHKFYVARSINLRSHSPGVSHHYAAAAGVTLSLNLHSTNLGVHKSKYIPRTS